MKSKTTSTLLIVILSLSYTLTAIGQKKMDTTDNSYKWDDGFPYKVASIGLRDLRQSKDSIYIRFWCGWKAFEVWTLNGKNYKGSLYVFSGGKIEGDTTGRYFTSSVTIDSAKIEEVVSLLNSLHNIPLPVRDTLHKGDEMILDGTFFQVEYATPTLYSYRVYYNPASLYFKTKKVEKDLDSILNPHVVFNRLIDSLPHGMYGTGGNGAISK
jgi:hypothetical protein